MCVFMYVCMYVCVCMNSYICMHTYIRCTCHGSSVRGPLYNTLTHMHIHMHTYVAVVMALRYGAHFTIHSHTCTYTCIHTLQLSWLFGTGPTLQYITTFTSMVYSINSMSYLYIFIASIIHGI